jgi:hypothetical protein
MKNFRQIGHSAFYGEVWPRIQGNVEAIKSNWATFRKSGEPLRIEWGDPKTKKITAINLQVGEEMEYWIKKE